MRASPVVVAILVALLVGCRARADDPKVNAPISPEDVREICALVSAETSEPISEISEVTTEAYTPGVTPRQVVSIAANGERHETTMLRARIAFGSLHIQRRALRFGSTSRRRKASGRL